VVTEQPDRLIFENDGDFFDGQPIDYVEGSKTPRRYRNPFLAQAMVELNMIDTMGYGIHSMYRGQARRYFPMPDYDLSQPYAVRMTLYGAIVDPAYSRLLIQKTDLPLGEVVALDRVQKGLSIDDEAIKRLRRRNLIEGRKPNLHVSSTIASATGTKADYIRTRAQDDEHYRKLIVDFVAKFQSATRADIEKLLLKNLSDALDDDQKRRKISNLLTGLRRSGQLENAGSRKEPKWILVRPKD
jgi:ATP-dependent DNA helicase RecG